MTETHAPPAMSEDMRAFANAIENMASLEARWMREDGAPEGMNYYFLFDGVYQGKMRTLWVELPVVMTRLDTESGPLTVVLAIAMSVCARRFGTVMLGQMSNQHEARPSVARDRRMVMSCMMGEPGRWYGGMRRLEHDARIEWYDAELETAEPETAIESNWATFLYNSIDRIMRDGSRYPRPEMTSAGVAVLRQWDGKLKMFATPEEAERVAPSGNDKAKKKAAKRKASVAKTSRRKNRR